MFNMRPVDIRLLRAMVQLKQNRRFHRTKLKWGILKYCLDVCGVRMVVWYIVLFVFV